MMKVNVLHGWQMGTAEAQEIQRQLAGKVSTRNEVGEVSLVAGVDISAHDQRGPGRGAVVVLRYPELSPVEVRTAEMKPPFPYVPGLLSFRESPLILAACEKLSVAPDLVLVDGQGLAHPRRFGLASHLGLLLDTPAIGCAKSLLCGEHGAVGPEPGDYALLKDGNKVIGAALRTKAGSQPLYISIGHRVDLEGAIKWVLACCRGYRLPEPTRLAHLAAGGRLAEGLASSSQEKHRSH